MFLSEVINAIINPFLLTDFSFYYDGLISYRRF
jgi:hypothetical protein